MRIAFFIDDYLPSVHGVATSTATFRKALEDMGHEVFIVAPKVEGYTEADERIIRLASSKYYVFDSREMGRHCSLRGCCRAGHTERGARP